MTKKNLLLFVLIVCEILLITYCRNIFGSLLSPVVLLIVSVMIGVLLIYPAFDEVYVLPSLNWKLSKGQTLYLMLFVFYLFIVILLIIPKGSIKAVYTYYPIDPKYSDIIPTIRLMCERFINGANVYAKISEFGYEFFPGYLPFSWLPFLPAEYFHFDYRMIVLLIFIVTVTILIKNGYVQKSEFANMLSLLLLFFFIKATIDKEPASLGWTVELMNASFYTLLLIGILNKNTYLKVVAILLCLLTRYSVVVLLPLFLLVELKETGVKRSVFLVMLITVLVSVIMVPIFYNNWSLPEEWASAYSRAGIGEWRHLDANGLPLHIFNGTGFASWVFKYKSGSIEERFTFLQKTHFYLVLSTTLILSVIYWLKRKALDSGIYLAGAVKIYFSIFYGFIQVPYTYLFLVPVFYSVAVFVLLNRNVSLKEYNRGNKLFQKLFSFRQKALSLFPYIILGWYLGMAVYYYKARITYGDTGYYLYKMIQSEGFNIESGRAISVISQWLPLLLIKLSAPLRIVMIGYSVNFALVYVAGFLLIRYLLKSEFLAWGALLCTHLFLHYGYFYPTEMIFSSAVMVFIMAFLTFNDRNKEKPIPLTIWYGVGVALLLSISLIHPFYYVVAMIILFCLHLIEPNIRYIHFIVLAILILIVKITFFKSGYEAGKLSGIDINVFSWKAIDKSYLTFFWRQTFNHRLPVTKFLFYGFIIYLCWRRKWLLAAALPFGYLALYLLVYLSIPNGESLGYMECYMAAISVFPLIVFLVYAEKNLMEYKNTFIFMAFILSLLGLARMKSETIYKARVKYLESIFAYGRENNIAKFFVEDNEIKHDKILVGWALPYETLLLSTVSGKTQTIYLNTDKKKLEEINNNQLFLGVPWEEPIHEIRLRKRYFTLDSTPYKRINGLEF
jgi:hypothetical protein